MIKDDKQTTFEKKTDSGVEEIKSTEIPIHFPAKTSFYL
jgi:hypothetical protein